MKKHSGVYVIVNIDNQKRYIGSSLDVRQRLEYHKNSLRRGTNRHKHLQSAFNKYGEAKFTFGPLLYCDPEMTLIYEQTCLDEMRPEYNKATCAESPMRGYKMTDIQKARISIFHTGRKVSEETRAKMSAARKGHKVSEATRAKLSAANKGKSVSKETREKIGNLAKGRVASDESRAKMSKAQKGIPMSEKEREILSARMIGNKYSYGRKPSDETRQKLRAINNGRVMTDEQRKKLSDALKGNKHALGHKVSALALEKMIHRKNNIQENQPTLLESA